MFFLTIALTLALEREGWEVHNQVEDPSLSGPSLEDDPTLADMVFDEDKYAEINRRLQAIDHTAHKRALILFCSHIGGHKYAGNVIVSPLRVLRARGSPSESLRVIARRLTLHGTIADQHPQGCVSVVRAGDASRGGCDSEGDDHWWEDPHPASPRRHEPLSPRT